MNFMRMNESMKIEELFEKYEYEYMRFESIAADKRTSNRPDLHAFNLLDKIIPGDCDIVSAASHDEFWLEISPDELTKAATEEQILELIRCGVRLDTSTDSLAMFT